MKWSVTVGLLTEDILHAWDDLGPSKGPQSLDAYGGSGQT